MPEFQITRTEIVHHRLLIEADNVDRAEFKARGGAIEHLLTNPGVKLESRTVESQVCGLRTIEEPETSVAARQRAAAKWAEQYRLPQVRTSMADALAVITKTGYISDYLARVDPMALQQAQEALSGTSYVNYL